MNALQKKVKMLEEDEKILNRGIPFSFTPKIRSEKSPSHNSLEIIKFIGKLAAWNSGVGSALAVSALLVEQKINHDHIKETREEIHHISYLMKMNRC